MTNTRDDSDDIADTVVSGDLQLPTRTADRGATLYAQKKKCFYCRQDRQKVRTHAPTPCDEAELSHAKQ
jgi:hypothetical protein